jgi:hypothetical protein
MGRFEPTSQVVVERLEHSVIELPWGVLRGALGPSDGSAGAAANVPSALSVLRHAALYTHLPAEIEEAFEVLEQHAIRHRVLYPVAVTVAPFLFDLVRQGNAHAGRITDLLGEYAAAASSLEPLLRDRLIQIIFDHGVEICGWIGTHDRAAAALAIHVPELRDAYLATVEGRRAMSPTVLLALIELGEAPGASLEIATRLLDGADAPDLSRMAAAAFLARFGELTPSLATRIDGALPPSAPAALAKLVGDLWQPVVSRPAVAPKLHDAEVVFAGEKLVLVRAGDRTVTVPWANANVVRGDRLKVGITAHGQAQLVVLDDGSVPFVSSR